MLPTAVPVAPQPVVNLPPFTWTATPTFEGIPTVPAAGLANGRPMPVQGVWFEPGDKGWRIQLSDQPLPEPTAIITAGQSVTLELPEEPAVGKRLEHKLAAGPGAFQVAIDPQNPMATTALASEHAWVLEITKWEAKPYDPKGDTFQAAGLASGRIAVCFKGMGTIQDSWIAGTFADAPIRYMGKPGAKDGGRATGGQRPALPDPANRDAMIEEAKKQLDKNPEAKKQLEEKAGVKPEDKPKTGPLIVKPIQIVPKKKPQ